MTCKTFCAKPENLESEKRLTRVREKLQKRLATIEMRYYQRLLNVLACTRTTVKPILVATSIKQATCIKQALYSVPETDKYIEMYMYLY